MEVVACTHQACNAKAIAMSMAYFLYLQCAKGTVDPEWKVTPVSGPRFWQKMSLQMVQYKCSNLHYPGDEKMRKNTLLQWTTTLVVMMCCVILGREVGKER